MKTLGIIAEYNPFHNGHLYQMLEARKRSAADHVIVVMSPDFVQRGDPALLDKWVRARMALLSGADLVIELPIRCAAGSAEFFASGGVSLLASLGVVDALSFGCEADDITPLKEYAHFLCENEPEDYRSLLQDRLRLGDSFAKARCLSYLEYTGTEDPEGSLSSPNNILAVEYMKAQRRLGSDMEIFPIKRLGAGYHDTDTDHTFYVSASGIRSDLSDNGFSPERIDHIEDHMPHTASCLLKEAISEKRYLVPSDFDLPLHLALYENRSCLTDFVDVTDDLANRIENLLMQYTGFDQFTSLVKSRQTAYTRVHRALLHILLGLRKEQAPVPHISDLTDEAISGLPEKPQYARILGFRKEASALLHEIKQHSSIPLITKLPGEDLMPSALSEDIRASHLWEMVASHKTGAPVRNERQRRMIIETGKEIPG